MPHHHLSEFEQGFNAAIVSLAEQKRRQNSTNKPRVGDIMQRKDGKQGRVVHDYGDKIQINDWRDDNTTSGSFHLGNSGNMSYSGGCGECFEPTLYKLTDEFVKASCWIANQNRLEAGCGVDVQAWVSLWVEQDKSQVIDNAIDDRIIIKSNEPFNGRIQSTTYTTLDGVERVQYRDGQTLTDYLQENKDCKVITHAEYDTLQDSYLDTLVTKPNAITQESFYDLLECLPPCRAARRFGVYAFHMSERDTANIVQWLFEFEDSNGKEHHAAFTDYDSISEEALTEKIGQYINNREV